MTVKTMRALVLLAGLICAASCAHKPAPAQGYPPSADLRAPPEPRAPAEALTSEKAANAYSAAVLVWGRSLQAQVDRLCRWAQATGMADAPCAAQPGRPRPASGGQE